MSSVLSSASFSHAPLGFVDAVCVGCGTALFVPGGVDATCPACRRSHAENEAQRLLGDAKALASGSGVFSALSLAEREEQYQALVLGTLPAPAPLDMDSTLRSFVAMLGNADVAKLAGYVAQERARRSNKGTGKVPVIIAASVAMLSDVALMDLAVSTSDGQILSATSAELADRLGNLSDGYGLPVYSAGEAPDAQTRDDIESQIERIDAELDGLEHERDSLTAVRSRRKAAAILDDASTREAIKELTFDADFGA